MKNKMLRADNLNAVINDNNLFLPKKYSSTIAVGVLKGKVVGLPHDLWLKRFNEKGFFDFLLKRLFWSRAERLFLVSQRLYEKGLPIPMPVAFIKPSFRIRHAFFLSLLIEDSENLLHAYKKGLFDKNVARQLAEALSEWHMAGAVHGDLKWSNILMQKNNGELKFFFVDLDQAKLYSRPKIKGIIKDLVRFYRGGLELGAEEWVDSKFFPQYIAHIPSEIKVDIDLRYIKERALKDWKRKGQKRFRID